jgi:hypothetical protein
LAMSRRSLGINSPRIALKVSGTKTAVMVPLAHDPLLEVNEGLGFRLAELDMDVLISARRPPLAPFRASTDRPGCPKERVLMRSTARLEFRNGKAVEALATVRPQGSQVRAKFIFEEGFTEGMEIIKGQVCSGGEGKDYGVISTAISIDEVLRINLETGATLASLRLGHDRLHDQEQLSSK